jgi:hypothetical protein
LKRNYCLVPFFREKFTLAKPEFDSLSMPDRCRRIVLIRDLRGTLISGYFSIRYSHVVDNSDAEMAHGAVQIERGGRDHVPSGALAATLRQHSTHLVEIN